MFSRTETYTISEFLNDKHKSSENNLSYAYLAPTLFGLNNPIDRINKIPKPPTSLEGMGLDLQSAERFGHIGKNSISNLTEAINSLNNFMMYLVNPSLLIKKILIALVDLAFPVAAITSIIALCMYVFTGCKDKSPLKYVGLSVALMYVFTVIVSQIANQL